MAWSWDPSLYSGSASFYVVGRVAYPPEIAQVLVAELGLDGTQTLLDVGCGPGSLTLLLAPYFRSVTGVDADPDMLATAVGQARAGGIANASWRHMRAEELPADFSPVDVVTFAQSFHWMDRPRVASSARGLVKLALVHVSARTHAGVATSTELPHPQPPWDAVDGLIEKHLGSRLRAGQGTLSGDARAGETEIYRAAGFHGPRDIEIPRPVVDRSTDEIVASVYSLSRAAPHLFGDRLQEFDEDLRALLRTSSPGGHFSEQMAEIVLHIWR
jgi:SAM-dependent methyltransferase